MYRWFLSHVLYSSFSASLAPCPSLSYLFTSLLVSHHLSHVSILHRFHVSHYLSRLFTSNLFSRLPSSFSPLPCLLPHLSCSLSLPQVLFFPISFLLSSFLPSLLFSLILSSSLSCPRAQLLLPLPDQCWNSSWILTFQFMNCTACQSPRGHRHSPSIVSCVIKACCQANQSDHATEIPQRCLNILS